MSVKVAAVDLQIWVFTFTAQVQFVASGALNFQRLKMQEQLNDVVIQLHDIARAIEQHIGSGQLSADIRSAADRLNMLINPVKQDKQ
jgi:hypothetical protein